MSKVHKNIEDTFSGDLGVLRIIFSTKNPIHTLHLLKTEIPYTTAMEYLEYLDVYEELKAQAEIDAKEKAAAEAANARQR